MQAYREISPAAFRAQLAYAQLVTFESRAENDSGHQFAAAHHIPRSTLYAHRATVLRALRPDTPGPQPRSAEALALRRAQPESEGLRVRIVRLERSLAELQAQHASSLPFDTRKQRALELVLAVENVSLQGIQKVFEVLTDGSVRPRVEDLHLRRKEAGLAAQRLLTRARGQVAKTLACVMGDDIFFAGCAVKVVAEPRSVAILNIGRWPWHKEEDWTLWLEEFEGLEVFISDLGTDICNAAQARDVWHQADWFHEERWWAQKVLAPLDRREKEARAALAVATRQQARVGLPERSTRVRVRRRGAPRVARVLSAEQERRHLVADIVSLCRAHARAAERQWYVAYGVLEQIRWLYQVADAQGELWTDETVAAALVRNQTDLDALPGPVGAAAREHVRAYGARYTAHRRLMNRIAVLTREGSVWNESDVRQGVYELLTLEHKAARASGSAWGALEDRALALRERLQQECENLEEVEQALARHCKWVPRPSSAVESLNSQLRVLQTLHRTVSDEMLWLHALAWNLTPRKCYRARWLRSS